MDVLEQVEKILKKIETQETRKQFEKQTVDGLVLAELVKQYNDYIQIKDFKKGHECLLSIFQLVVSMI